MSPCQSHRSFIHCFIAEFCPWPINEEVYATSTYIKYIHNHLDNVWTWISFSLSITCSHLTYHYTAKLSSKRRPEEEEWFTYQNKLVLQFNQVSVCLILAPLSIYPWTGPLIIITIDWPQRVFFYSLHPVSNTYLLRSQLIKNRRLAIID